MIHTDSRGVQYDISTVRAGRRHAKMTFDGAGSSQIVERISDRPVDIKRKQRAAKRVQAQQEPERIENSPASSEAGSCGKE